MSNQDPQEELRRLWKEFNGDQVGDETVADWWLSKLAEREQAVREICICAAVKTTGNVVIRGHRHADCIRTIKEYNGTPLLTPEAQGFVTSRNRFVTREEGRKLQDAAGKVSADETGYRGDTLFSEDLY